MPAPVYARSATPGRYLKYSTYGGSLYGGDGNEHLQAYARNVTLSGGKGDDTYAVYDSSTKIVEASGGGIDTVITYGSYTLSANLENLFMLGAGNDVGMGNSGNNLIIDKDGNDRLITGGGNDVLVSGNGANTFVATKQAGSVTWVQNFKTSGTLDRLELTGYGFEGFASVQAKMTQVGSDLRIDLGNSQYIWLEGRTASQITAGSVIVEAAPTTTGSTGGTTGGTTSGSTGSTGGTTGGTGTTTPSAPVLPSPNAPLSGMKLTFDEEFNSLSLRTGTTATANGIWKTSDGWGNRTLHGNNELQLYVDPDYKGLGLNPFSVQDGIVTITASKTPDWAKSAIGYNYISGELTTAGSFAQQYGYFEMKAQMAPGQGMWPAFWMLSTNGKWPPEIDIVEAIGDLPNHVYVNTHSATNGNAGKDVWSSADITQGFHTYGVDWTASTITFYYDGKAVFTRATPADMHTPMYMLLNLAVGGNWPGAPDSTTDWSKTQYKIDYVRVWSHDQNAAVYSNVPSGSTADTTSSSGSGTTTTPSPTSALAAVLSNATNPLDLADSFTASVGANGSSATYTGSQMAIAGVSSSASVTVSYDAAGGLTVKNNGEWNAVKNATVKSTASGSVAVQNFVDAEISLGDGADTVSVKDAKRGTIATAGGNDTITINAYNSSAYSNLATDNLMTVNAGDGNDVVTFTGASNTRAAIDGGAGDDRIEVNTAGAVTLTGGAGADVFAFIAGAHATITDFNASADRIELKGVSASTVSVTVQNGSTLIDLGGGANITLSGVSLSASSLNLAYAA